MKIQKHYLTFATILSIIFYLILILFLKTYYSDMGLVNGEWIQDRIEMSGDGNWYLVESKLKGNDLEHLQVKK